MNFIHILNLLLAPLGALIAVSVDYAHNTSADPIQRRGMSFITVFAIMAILLEMLCETYSGFSGDYAYITLYTACFLFFVFQLAAFAAIPYFLDYFINRDVKRLRRLGIILLAVMAINVIALVANIWTGFYFDVTGTNHYQRGEWHCIRVALDYLVFVIAVVDFLLCVKKAQFQHWMMCLFSVFPAAIFGACDLFIPGSRLLWPCFSLSFLFAYLFVLKTEYAYDPLTGAYTRRKCNEILTGLAKTAKRKPYLFIMVDMDRFKDINDKFGHQEGDNALKDAAAILQNSMRRQDVVARYGGDEFLVVMENCEHPEPFVERIRRGVRDFNAGGNHPYTLSMSMGYDVYRPEMTEPPLEFLRHVDRLMYQNKNESRKTAHQNA